MKVMHSEWTDRIQHWIRTLKEDFYEPLGEISWEAFRTREHLKPEEAASCTFTKAEPGFTWGETWEYCWFRGSVTLPAEAEGKAHRYASYTGRGVHLVCQWEELRNLSGRLGE